MTIGQAIEFSSKLALYELIGKDSSIIDYISERLPMLEEGGYAKEEHQDLFDKHYDYYCNLLEPKEVREDLKNLTSEELYFQFKNQIIEDNNDGDFTVIENFLDVLIKANPYNIEIIFNMLNDDRQQLILNKNYFGTT